MEFGFLLDHDRKLLSIGYLVAEGTLDPSCYDLLASEARLASFMAIAKGDVPARHWFRLGRAVTPVAHGAALISWSGSMFEYLMPSLVMRAPEGSLVERTSRLIVRRQIDYGAKLGVPWGISESAYNARDLEFTYQYSNFGVPGLGLKRGLGENVVVAPYATALATMVDPQAAARNFDRLAAAGARGRYGFYEALDYTPTRVPEGKTVAIVRAFMAHHQGMTIVAIADALLDGAMRARFHAEPIVQATELLLQERAPRDVAVARPWAAEEVGRQDLGRRAARRPAAHHSAQRDARHAPALERPLCGDAHGRRLGLQPLARSGRDPLARGRHLRRMGLLRLFARRRQRRRMVGGISAERHRARRLRGHFQRGSRRVHAPRRNAHDDHGGARLGRRRCRGPSRLDLELRQPRAGDRRHVLC